VDPETRVALVKEVGEEIVTEEELRALLAAKAHPIAYDGFEPSGTAHIAQGVMRAINVNKMTRAGFRFKMFVADWHAWANNKMGGDLEKIQTTGKYLIEIWRATGMDLSKVDFAAASEAYREASGAASGELRAQARIGQARTLALSGKKQEADAMYRQILAETADPQTKELIEIKLAQAE